MKRILLLIAIVAIALVMETSCTDAPALVMATSCTDEPGKHTVTLNANDGTGNAISQIFTKGTAQKLTKNSFTVSTGRSKFLGWNTDKEATIATITDEANYTATANVTLYAIWGYEIGDRGPAGGFIFYDVDADNNDGKNGGRGLDNLTSLTTVASGDMPANWKYLEAAPYDIKVDGDNISLATTAGGGSDIPFSYYRTTENGNNLFTDGTQTPEAFPQIKPFVGQGANNTKLIVQARGDKGYTQKAGSDTTKHYAAKVCDELKVTHNENEFKDWFLPSHIELIRLSKSEAFENCHIGSEFPNEGRYISSTEIGIDKNVINVSSVKYNNYYSSWNYFVTSSSDAYKVRAIRAVK